MKVLSIVHNTVCSGAAKSFLNLIIGLKEKNIEIMVITPTDGYLCQELKKIGIPYIKVPISFSSYPNLNTFSDKLKFFPRLLKMIIKNVLAIFKISSAIRKYQPDIIHTNVSVINVGYYAAKFNKVKHIWHIREYGDIDFNIKPFPSKKIKQQRLNKESYTISITKDIADYFSLGKNNRIIYNGVVNNEKIQITNKKENLLIFVGSLTQNKGVPLIVESFIKFHKKYPDYKLYLIGEGDTEFVARLESQVYRNNLSNHIQFLGYKDDVYSYMQRAKALVVASKREGFGRITAEAMANGCLVIGLNSGGTKEQFDNGKNLTGHEIGLRFNNKSELIEAMCFVTEMDEAQYSRIVVAAQSVAHSLYSKKANVENTYNFFLDILKK